MTRYTAQAFDRVGLVADEPTDNFASLLCRARDLAAERPACVVFAYNLDQTDANFDGLTEDEREAVEIAVAEGHRLAVQKASGQ